MAAQHGQAERRASDVGRRSLLARAPARNLTAAADRGTHVLTPAGRAHFGSIIGADVADAKIHVDADAQRISSLAHAEAVTHGRNVFIPPARFAPGTEQGRALIAHELTHVTQAPSAPNTLFRKGTPHYPTEDEQKEIEKIVGRHTTAPAAKPAKPAEAGEPEKPAEAEKPAEETIVDTGSTLSDADVDTLATELLEPYRATLSSTFPTSGEPSKTVEDLDQAMDLSQKALKAIESEFGSYIDQPITLTKDPASTLKERTEKHQVKVELSFDDSDVQSFALTIITTYCGDCKKKLSGLAQDSRDKVITALLAKVFADADLADKVKKAAKTYVGGAYSRSTRTLHLTPFGHDPYGNAVHELMHSLTHPAFHAAFIDERDILEGFTEYMTLQALSSKEKEHRAAYKPSVDMISRLRAAMHQPFFTSSAVDSSEASLRQAYFRGRLDLIGWRPNSDAEAKAVADAGGATAWNPETAATEQVERTKRARAAQGIHSNVLGFGLFFQKEAGTGSFAVRYARVVNRSELARRQLYVEGQIVGSPIDKPQRLGGSLGLGIEFQEPWLYVTGGARVIGTGALSGPSEARFDISPFLGVGTRLWQHVRVGAEGVVLFQLTGDKSIDVGVGGTVGVEF